MARQRNPARNTNSKKKRTLEMGSFFNATKQKGDNHVYMRKRIKLNVRFINGKCNMC